MLKEIITEDATKRLWEILKETRGMPAEKVGYTGGNVATLLRMKGESFEGSDLAQMSLSGADLSLCQLTKTNLTDCDLHEASLNGSRFNEDALKSAKLGKTEIFIIGHGKFESSRKQFGKLSGEDKHSFVDKLFNQIEAKISRYDSTVRWDNDGNFNFIIKIKIDEPITWGRDKILQIPSVQHIAIYNNEIEEIRRYIPNIDSEISVLSDF